MSRTHTFQVDLRGLVDLLSRYLYSSPKVCLRELLRNAADAVTARGGADPGAPAAVRLSTADGGLRVEDSGAGQTEAEMHRLLACFVVAEEIRVVSRSAREPAAPVEWTARGDGSYTARTAPGTTVHLIARADADEWLTSERATELARHHGSLLLPYDIRVDAWPVTARPAVWERAYPSPAARRAALAEHCRTTLGFTPLDSDELDIPLTGLRGVAYVLPDSVSRGAPQGHAPDRAGRRAAAALGVLRTLRPGQRQPAPRGVPREPVPGRDPGRRDAARQVLREESDR